MNCFFFISSTYFWQSVSHDRIGQGSEGPYVRDVPTEKIVKSRSPEPIARHKALRRYRAIVAIFVVIIIGLILGLALGLTRNSHQQAAATAMPTTYVYLS